MAHASENSSPLNVNSWRPTSLTAVPDEPRGYPAVWFFVLPLQRSMADAENSQAFHATMRAFSERVHSEATVAVLASPPEAAVLLPEIEGHLRFQLWVAVKLDSPVPQVGQLPSHHAALLILTKYPTLLRHTKTRIAYGYCPACDKTTKDYGGKKHTYHDYGTLISDVWRDISVPLADMPVEVIRRVRDLFGLPPYRDLNVVDLRSAPGTALMQKVNTSTGQPEASNSKLESALVNGDALEAIARLPSESVDFCFADPPYNLKKRYDSWGDSLDIVRYFQWCDEWLNELGRVIKPGRTCAVLNIPLWAVRHFSHLRKILRYQSWIAWEGLSLPVRMIMPAHYSILCFSKGEPAPLPGLTRRQHSPMEREALTPLGEFYCLRSACVAQRNFQGVTDRGELTDLWWDIHRLKHNTRRVDHPCQLPPGLMRRLIALFTNEGELILDPFNGAGTSTLVAEQLNRRYFGIEISKTYHDLALRRHRQLRGGFDPFAKTNRVPGAKNSPVKRLQKQKYAVSKKMLQLEVRRIARTLGHMPTRSDVERLSRFPMEYYRSYFISWGEVCAAARTTGMSENRPGMKHSDHSRQRGLFAEE